jgi:hypothetical protein
MPPTNRLVDRYSSPSLGNSIRCAAARFGQAAMVALLMQRAAEAQERARSQSVEVCVWRQPD